MTCWRWVITKHEKYSYSITFIFKANLAETLTYYCPLKHMILNYSTVPFLYPFFFFFIKENFSYQKYLANCWERKQICLSTLPPLNGLFLPEIWFFDLTKNTPVLSFTTEKETGGWRSHSGCRDPWATWLPNALHFRGNNRRIPWKRGKKKEIDTRQWCS